MHNKIKPINGMRIFVNGVSDNETAIAVKRRARSLSGVIDCQVSTSGICILQLSVKPTTANKRLLLNQLTFDT